MKTEIFFLDAQRLETTSISRELLNLKEKQDYYRQKSFVGTRRNQPNFSRLCIGWHGTLEPGRVPNSELALPVHPVSPMEITFNKCNHQKS